MMTILLFNFFGKFISIKVFLSINSIINSVISPVLGDIIFVVEIEAL